jgi:hypothetical protein
VEFPIFYQRESSDKCIIYELKSSPLPNQFIPVKMKIIDGNRLAVKMRSGSYLLVEKIGTYYNELNLCPKLGFKIDQN